MRKTNTKRRGAKKVLTGEAIDAMTDEQRSKLAAEFDAETTEQRLARAKPLNAKQRATWRSIKKRMGRPQVGKGSKPITLTVEKELLERADALARQRGMKRTELVAQGLRMVLGDAM